MDWIELAQYRDRWWALVNVVIWGEFLDKLFSFSRTLLHGVRK
jgi:hypothetical protein